MSYPTTNLKWAHIRFELHHILKCTWERTSWCKIQLSSIYNEDPPSDPISNQVSYLSWTVNLTAGLYSPHRCLKCTSERENAGVKFNFPPFITEMASVQKVAPQCIAVHGEATNQSGLVWEKNSWHATSHVVTSVCRTILYILLWYTFGCDRVSQNCPWNTFEH